MSGPSGPHSPERPPAPERGYNQEHRRLRQQALADWQDGDPCARCGGPMRHGTDVHLDHTDDRTGYLGLSHASCNLSHTGRLDNVQHHKVCDHCGLTYTTRYLTQRYCTNACRRSAPKPARQPKPVVWHSRTCGTCGVAFSTRRANKHYCSRRCGEARGLTCTTCGQPCARSTTTRPQGEAICHPCRKTTPQQWRRAS